MSMLYLGWSRHHVWTSNDLGDFAVRVEVNVKVKVAFAFGLTWERHHLKNNVPACLGLLNLGYWKDTCSRSSAKSNH